MQLGLRERPDSPRLEVQRARFHRRLTLRAVHCGIHFAVPVAFVSLMVSRCPFDSEEARFACQARLYCPSSHCPIMMDNRIGVETYEKTITAEDHEVSYRQTTGS
jgi:hypothetical protein